jgi:Relaxase/Mobilisation nuclease domain
MIPRIQTGTSFKGAELYYLHDKKRGDEHERLTAGRLAWTYAINTLENEPEAVFAEMRQTSFDQSLLKQLSGNRLDGRPTERPVMTVALAWSPDQSPNRQDMIDAGMSFLQHMRWHEHQVLFVAHNDTKHPHVHLIINRVHPVSGMTIDDNWSKTRSQRWALAYEREHGHIYCLAREARHDRDRGSDAQHTSYREWQTYQEFTKDKAIDPEFQQAMRAGEWDALKSGQKDERLGFWQETGRMRKQVWSALRADVRFEFADQWKAYAQEKEERQRKANVYDREARHAIRELRKQQSRTKQAKLERRSEIAVVKGPDGRTFIKRRSVESEGIEQIKERRRAYHLRRREELWEMRSEIFTRQKERLGTVADIAFARLGADRAEQYHNLLAAHRGERRELTEDQRAGERRPDALKRGTTSTGLTPEQIAGYTAEARKIAVREADQQNFRRAMSDADRSRSGETGRDRQDAKPAKETTDRALEQQGKERAREANQKADTDFYLRKRAADRARDRGGGRER